jgi:hypothetical protein
MPSSDANSAGVEDVLSREGNHAVLMRYRSLTREGMHVSVGDAVEIAESAASSQTAAVVRNRKIVRFTNPASYGWTDSVGGCPRGARSLVVDPYSPEGLEGVAQLVRQSVGIVAAASL